MGWLACHLPSQASHLYWRMASKICQMAICYKRGSFKTHTKERKQLFTRQIKQRLEKRWATVAPKLTNDQSYFCLLLGILHLKKPWKWKGYLNHKAVTLIKALMELTIIPSFFLVQRRMRSGSDSGLLESLSSRHHHYDRPPMTKCVHYLKIALAFKPLFCSFLLKVGFLTI